MKFLQAIIDSLAAFVQRNPTFVMIVLLLALFAPSLLSGIASFVLYLILGLLLFALVGGLLLRWRIAKFRRQMEEQMRGTQGFDPRQGFGDTASGAGFGRGFGFGGRRTQRPADEGEVRVHVTSETPEKRISSDVGDYVEFEETKGPKK